MLEDYGLLVHHPQREDSEGLLALPALQEALQRPEPEVLLLRGEGGATCWSKPSPPAAPASRCSNSIAASARSTPQGRS